MNIDISGIVNEKLHQLETDGVIEKTIEETFETTLKKAVVDALDSWSIKRKIEEKVASQVSPVVESLDFTTYNSFIAEKMKEVVNGVCRVDLCEKIEHMVGEMFLCKRENVKLSEVFDLYQKHLCDSVEESDKYSRERFYVSMEEDPRWHWITITLDEDPEWSKYGSGDPDMRFTVHQRSDGSAFIGTVYLKGVDTKGTMKFGHLNDAELLLVQASYNDIPVIVDVEDEDDVDNSYDVDI